MLRKLKLGEVIIEGDLLHTDGCRVRATSPIKGAAHFELSFGCIGDCVGSSLAPGDWYRAYRPFAAIKQYSIIKNHDKQ